MLASIPASTLNQSLRDLEIPNRFTLKSSRFSGFSPGAEVAGYELRSALGHQRRIPLGALCPLRPTADMWRDMQCAGFVPAADIPSQDARAA